MNRQVLAGTRPKSWPAYLSYSMLYFFYYGAMGFFTAMLSVYLAGGGKSAAEIAWIVSGAGIFTTLLQPFIGMVYNRVRHEWQLSVLLLLLSGTLGFSFVLFRSTALLFLCNGLTMTFLNSVTPFCERLATQSPFRYGVIRFWGGVGYAVTCQLSGLIFEYASPTLNFAFFALAAALAGIGFWNCRRDQPSRPQTPAGAAKAGGWAGLFRDPAFLLFSVFCFLFYGSTAAGTAYLPILLRELLGSSALAGSIISAATLLEVPLVLLSHRYMDRFSGKTLLLANLAVFLAQYLCYAFCTDALVVCAVAILTKAVTTMLFIMVSLKVVLDLMGEQNSTMALSITASAKMLGSVAVTWLAGCLAESFGTRMVFAALSAAGAPLMLILCLLRIPRRNKPYFSAR